MAAPLVLLAGVAGVPITAFGDVVSDVRAQAAEAYRWAMDAPVASVERRAALPSRFDLREKGVVSEVRNQSPWETCWSFGTVAASEISIQSEARELGVSLADAFTIPVTDECGGLDLSERHLAWFAFTPLPEDDDSGQGGEGLHSYPGSQLLDSGGWSVYGTSLFSSGVGPTAESRVPYRSNEGTSDYWDDWSVGEQYRFEQLLELEESFVLPEPSGYNAQGDYENAKRCNDAIKDQLAQGRAVAIGYMSDSSVPGYPSDAGYLNPGVNEDGTWAHYTYEAVGYDHVAAIVGWDDSYSRDHFGKRDANGEVIDEGTLPPGDGAWIVRNSWGTGWGTDDDPAAIGGDGYFYLSYYDQSIISPEAFDFDVERLASDEPADDKFYINQYDYMPAMSVWTEESASPIRLANVFSAEFDQEIRRVTCDTTRPNTRVTIDAYLLDEGASGPTDGTLVASAEDTFEYGGFHAIPLADDQCFTVGAGERFSVVVTQCCLDDGFYYASADMGLTKEVVDKVNDAAPGAINFYSQNVVHEGESYLIRGGQGELAERSDEEAVDFTEIVAAQEEIGNAVDNPAIKAYGYPVDDDRAEQASAESLAQLSSDVADARNILQNTWVSTDGRDVPEGTMWVTQGAHDAFEAAISAAEQALSADRPLAADVAEAREGLASARAVFDAVKADGLGGGDVESGREPDGGPLHPVSNPGGGLPRTGDPTATATGLVSFGGIVTMAVGAWSLLRNRIRR